MSKLKKVISLVLCFTMLLGTVAIAGDLFVPKAAAAATESAVKSYADLKAEYGDFIYYGIDVMEYDVNGDEVYTDYYVNAGDTLKILHYIKSTRYIANTDLFLEFDSDFFDIKVNGAYQESIAMKLNADHPIVGSKVSEKATARGYYADITTMDVYADYTYSSFGYTEEYTATIDSMGIIGAIDETVSAEAANVTSDLYLIEQTVTVKEGLADGTEGEIRNHKEFWIATDPENGDIFADISHTLYTVDEQSTSAIGDAFYSFDHFFNGDPYVAADKVIIDTERKFTIGANPNEGGSVVLPKAIFVENDGTEISSTEYAEGAEVAIPEAAANQIGWANVATGAVVESLEGFTMPARTVTFQRVLSTDKFDITLDAADAEFDTLPEGVTDNGDGTLTVKAGIGETVSFDDIKAEKTGYTGKWNPAEITLDNIKGAKATIEWVANTYNVKFYETKGDEASVINVEVAYEDYVDAPTVTKEGFNFVEWKSAADDSAANFEEPYTVAGDSAYYATWSECDSSIKFMIMDYATGEWKEYKTFYGNKDQILAKSELTAIVNAVKANPAVIGWNGEVVIENIFAFATAVDSGRFAAKDLTFDGHATYYINTKIKFNVEWNIPVYDEDADAYGTEFKTETADVTTNFNSLTVTTTLASSKYAPVMGYALKAWNIADAQATNYTANDKGTTFTLKAADGASQKYTAVYGLAEYPVTFAFGDIALTTYYFKTPVSIGDTIDLKNAVVVDKNGNEKTLPEIGFVVTNEFMGKAGYKLVNWNLGSTVAEFPIEVTVDFINANAKTGTIAFTAVWEAQAYDATFEYETADGTTETFVVSGITVGTLFEDFAPNEEKIAEINASAPEGHVFESWGNNGAMVAGGRTFTAVYRPEYYNAYIDYGNGKLDSEGRTYYDERKLCEAYGNDIWRDGAEDNDPGIGHIVVNVTAWGENNMPGKNYLPTGWEVYRLEENADLYDESTWKAGVNDEGTGIIKSDLVFRATWKQYNQFFFRVMDTSNKTYCALGKNFKMYYYSNGRSADKDAAVLNTSDSTIIIFFKPVLENFAFKSFFNKDMWENVCLRFDPITLPKSMFTVGGMTGIFRAAFDAIVNAIKGV